MLRKDHFKNFNLGKIWQTIRQSRFDKSLLRDQIPALKVSFFHSQLFSHANKNFAQSTIVPFYKIPGLPSMFGKSNPQLTDYTTKTLNHWGSACTSQTGHCHIMP